MPLFQKTVVNKFLKSQSQDHLSKKWDAFRHHFHNPTIQGNIKASKEEQYQEGFLRDLFVSIFGYILNPSHGYNLTTEHKNIKDSKKADGAIIFNEKVSAIIELKGTNTTDLSKIEEQAFGYKNNQKNCRYVITSNFEKLRFYVDDAIEHLEFNLFTLSHEEFNILYLCLGSENLEADIAGKIKDQSVSQEDAITKKLYSEYSVFKRELFKNLTELNPEYDPLELFKKSQKLLDRLLFLFFGEDRGLLPPNSVRTILDDWNRLKELDEDIPLYNRFKKYFGYLNTGFKGKKHDVFAYNGGLFKPDEVLDHIKIHDELLYTHTSKLADYDFASEVDVNILGHIFENSLNELDEVKAQLEGQEVDRSKSKRKKDGVFYTPKYITKYIVENTVGKLCEEKKAEIGVVEEEYTSDKNRHQKTKKTLLDKLAEYRNWLLQITIVDPACGSGAFLNEALNFLISEHKYIDELEAKITASSIAFGYYTDSILENNLFGVDLNEESVEIAKLSLWLRTAEPNRKLNSLNENIKCGNSLIDDPEVAGEKAFDWQKEFPKIFANGGFDVVIGNPPYVKESGNKNTFKNLQNKPCYQGKMDLWYCFGWLGLDISKINGLIGYIAPNNWITNDGASNFREKIYKDAKILEYIDFGDYKVFEEAGIQTMIYIMKRTEILDSYSFDYSKILDRGISQSETIDFLYKSKNEKFIFYSTIFDKVKFKNSIFTFIDSKTNLVLDKIESAGNFKLTPSEIFSGIDIGQDFLNLKNKNILGNEFFVGQGIFNLSNEEYQQYNFSVEEKKLIKPFYTTKEIGRYYSDSQNKYWVIYTTSKFKEEQEILPYQKIKLHLDKFSQIITSDNKPYGLHRARNENIFLGEKILSLRKCTRPTFSFVDFDTYVNRTFNIIKTKRINQKYLTSILNSKIVNYWLLKKGKLQGDIFQVDINPLCSIPIVVIDEIKQQPFIDKAEIMLQKNKDLQQVVDKFQRTLQREFGLENLPKKLQNWNQISFPEFLKEISKLKINLTLSQKDDWEEYFQKAQKNAHEISQQIEKTDKEIDAMVYELYGLSQEEIEIVETL